MARTPSLAAAHIGSLIVERRRELGLTQDEVAVMTGIDSSNIRAYENGRSMPNIHSLVRIAYAMDLEAGELLIGLTPSIFEKPLKKEPRGA